MKHTVKIICSLIILFFGMTAFASHHSTITITNNAGKSVIFSTTGKELADCVLTTDKKPIDQGNPVTISHNALTIKASLQPACTDGAIFVIQEAASVAQTATAQCSFSIDSNGILTKSTKTGICARITPSTVSSADETLTIN